MRVLHFYTFRICSRLFDAVMLFDAVLPLCGQREHLTTKFCCLLISEFQDADFAMLRTHFTGTTTWNNSKIIAEQALTFQTTLSLWGRLGFLNLKLRL